MIIVGLLIDLGLQELNNQLFQLFFQSPGISPTYSASPDVCHLASTFSMGWLTGQRLSSVSKLCFPLVRPRSSVMSLAPLLTAGDAESPRTWRKN